VNKAYVIRNNKGYIRIYEDAGCFEAVEDISDATFYDSETFAYEGLLKLGDALRSFSAEFYLIQCVAIVYAR